MSASFSLHIGVNLVDEDHYQGWNGRLYGCENDALFYYEQARKEGCITSKVLLSSDASNLPTSTNVLGFLDQGIRELRSGDNLFITYSGHGGILEDKNFDEEDFQDETWCLFDRQLLDDELYNKFSRFKHGVNIFVISDSCHSGSIVKSAGPLVETRPQLARVAPKQQLFNAYKANRSVYEPLMKRPIVRGSEIAAAVLQLGACQDDELAMEDGEHGLFTKTLMKVFERTGAPASYQELFFRTRRALNGIQKPNLVCYGQNHMKLMANRPFGSSHCEMIRQTPHLYGSFGDDTKLVIELLEEFDLSSVPKYRNIRRNTVPGTATRIGYHCHCSFDERNMYPWDQVYREYFYLKKMGIPVARIHPDGWPVNPLQATFADLNHELICDVLARIIPSHARAARGVGRTTDLTVDESFKRLVAMEVLQVIIKDQNLEPYRVLDHEQAAVFYPDPANSTKILELMKDSIYSSETLIAHL